MKINIDNNKNKITRFEKKIYISHAYGGKNKNLKKLTKIIKELVKKYPNYLFISPVHAFSFEYYIDDYDYGLSKCLALLDICDEIWVTGKNYTDSKGVFRETVYAFNNNIPIKYMSLKDNKHTEMTKWDNFIGKAKSVAEIKKSHNVANRKEK